MLMDSDYNPTDFLLGRHGRPSLVSLAAQCESTKQLPTWFTLTETESLHSLPPHRPRFFAEPAVHLACSSSCCSNDPPSRR